MSRTDRFPPLELLNFPCNSRTRTTHASTAADRGRNRKRKRGDPERFDLVPFQMIVPPTTSLHVEGTHMRVKSPPVLNKEERECLNFKGPSWIDTARLKSALRKR